MRLVLWSIVLSMIVLIFWAEVATPIVQKKHKAPEAELPVHITLYLEKSVFENEVNHVSAASLEWYNATDGQVIFDLATLPAADIDPAKSIVLVNVTPQYPQIIVLDSYNHTSTLAYCDRNATLPYIGIVYDRINEDEFNSVIMHELGHYMGLEHPDTKERPEQGMGSLMYSNITLGSNHITKFDLLQFCKLHHCDASKFHGLP